ncbi:hypothetical protein K2P56_01215 [Patescibacteria group bacterium]|nr:hypothetical protein [Patescibacteria group bacterium]
MDLLGNPGIAEPLKAALDYVIAFGADFFAFIVVAGAIATIAFYFGRDRLISLIAALYAGIVLYRAFPYGSLFPADNAYIQIGVFVGFTLVSLLAFSGLSFFLARSTSSFLGTAILSGVTAGLILAISIHVLPVQTIYTFSAPTLALFASPEMFFWWLVAPLAGLFFFGR